MLNTIHNLRYYQRVMEGLRGAIEKGELEAFVVDFTANVVKMCRFGIDI